MAENADFSSLLEEIKENMPELYQEMEAYAQRTGKSLAELSKDEAFVSRYSARYSERKDAVTALDNAVDEEIAAAAAYADDLDRRNIFVHFFVEHECHNFCPPLRMLS